MANKKTKHKKHRKFRLVIKTLLLLFLLGAIIGAVVLYLKYGDSIKKARIDAARIVDESSPDTFRAVETSLVFDDKGKQIAVLKGDKDIYYVGLDQIPQCVIDATLVTEDREFYSHKGINYKSTVAAVFSYIKNRGHISRGGSTITQQLVKNMFLTNEKTFSRKIKEAFIALELEKKYSKDQILEYYLNNIYYANGYYGIEAASKGYFGKSCSDLSLGEAMFLVAIPNNPTKYNPLENYENTIDRKNRVLDQMLGGEKISKDEYSEAYELRPELNVPKPRKKTYIETYALYCAIKALMHSHGFEFRNTFKSDKDKETYIEEYNEEYSICQNSLYRSGYRIYTSLNRKKQKMLQSAVNENLKSDKKKNEEGIYSFQGAGTCIDNYTGKVVAIVGGRKQSIDGYAYNRAYQSFRQPGSSIKPILVYAPAFENGYSPSDVVEDKPIEDGPKNSNGKYMGRISLREAVWYSTNTVAWNMLKDLTPKKCMPYLLNMNFSKITKDDYTLAAALGGLTNGVSTVEMTSAYAALANSGIYKEPTCIVKITDSQGNDLVDDSVFEPVKIYQSYAADAITDVLQGVFTNGTAKGFALSKMPCAGKTGTTNDKKDGWFAGYTPYYTTVIWVGNDIPKSRDDLLGNTYPARIWHDFMEKIHDGLVPVEFREYEDPNATEEPVATETPEPEETEEPEATEEPTEIPEEPTQDPAVMPVDPEITEPQVPDVPAIDPAVPADPGNAGQPVTDTPTEAPVSEPESPDTGDDTLH